MYHYKPTRHYPKKNHNVRVSEWSLKKSEKTTKTTDQNKNYIIIGRNRKRVIKVAYSNKQTFKENIIDFARTIDETEFKEQSYMLENIIDELNDNVDVKEICRKLIKAMFGYTIEMVVEVGELIYGQCYIMDLEYTRDSNNEPLPF